MSSNRPGRQSDARDEVAPALSVIIPTLDEAHVIGQTLDALARLGGGASLEVIVSDGGSLDGTSEVARGRGARVLMASRGRGAQMHAGARAAKGEVLWFLHADTRPHAGAVAEILGAMRRNPSAVGGNFAVRFDGGGGAARFMTWLYPRLRRLGLCYGDSAFFVRRDAYEEAGGFRPYPIFEDLDLLRRLRRRGPFLHLAAEVVTSSRRFERRSFVLTFTRWSLLQALYWLGVHPNRLQRHYAHVRGETKE
ncbi:MAG: TIGR04283 family arsenosugar biosynthesis glycosyltransferase [Pyrinomonadaceae bacterium]